MTMDKSLRVRKGATSARGVLSRAERIAKLKEQERWADGRSPLGLPNVLGAYELGRREVTPTVETALLTSAAMDGAAQAASSERRPRGPQRTSGEAVRGNLEPGWTRWGALG